MQLTTAAISIQKPSAYIKCTLTIELSTQKRGNSQKVNIAELHIKNNTAVHSPTTLLYNKSLTVVNKFDR